MELVVVVVDGCNRVAIAKTGPLDQSVAASSSNIHNYSPCNATPRGTHTKRGDGTTTTDVVVVGAATRSLQSKKSRSEEEDEFAS